MLLEPNPYALCSSCGEVYHEDNPHECNPMLVEFHKKKWSLETWHKLYPEIYQTAEKWGDEDPPHHCVSCLVPMKKLHPIFSRKGDCPRCSVFTGQTGYEVSPNRI